MRAAVMLLVLAVATTFAAAEKRPLTDGVVYDRVIRRLANDPDLKTTQVEVTVKDHTVTLRGLIDSEKLRLRAERVARKVDGVKTVVNELKLRP